MKTKARKAQAHTKQVERRQRKRAAKRRAYKPRTYQRQPVSYGQVRRAVDFALLHHYLMGR